jgi:hypothetical protein
MFDAVGCLGANAGCHHRGYPYDGRQKNRCYNTGSAKGGCRNPSYHLHRCALPIAFVRNVWLRTVDEYGCYNLKPRPARSYFSSSLQAKITSGISFYQVPGMPAANVASTSRQIVQGKHSRRYWASRQPQRNLFG